MSTSDKLLNILARIAAGNATDGDLDVMKQWLEASTSKGIIQFGKYNVNLGHSQGDIHI